jgi:hypothetical protein
MGPSWVPAREAVIAGTLRASDPHASETASRFEALIRFASLHLGRQLGTEVAPVLSRMEQSDPRIRLDRVKSEFVSEGALRASLRVPRAVSPLAFEANVRTGQISCSFHVEAPSQGRPTTRVNWLLRQLKDAPDSVRIEAFAQRSRSGAAALLKDARDEPSRLVGDPA